MPGLERIWQLRECSGHEEFRKNYMNSYQHVTIAIMDYGSGHSQITWDIIYIDMERAAREVTLVIRVSIQRVNAYMAQVRLINWSFASCAG